MRGYEVTKLYALIDISNQRLEDSTFDMEGEIRGQATEQFTVKEGAENPRHRPGRPEVVQRLGNYGYWRRQLSVIRSAFMSASSISRSGDRQLANRMAVWEFTPVRHSGRPALR
jgi:hypothetical protein